MGYSPERKAPVLKRMLPPNNLAIRQLSQEEGNSQATLHKWRAEARGKGRLVWQTVNDEGVFSEIDSDCTVHLPFHPLCFSCGAFPQVSVQAT
jgi:hypothetical protein